jgi:hypothetical protein
MPVRRGDGYRLWVGGPVPRGAAAITFGSWILVRADHGHDRHLLRHELVHVEQYRRLGVPRFLVRYVTSYLAFRLRRHRHYDAYRRIPFEIEAEWRARRAFLERAGEIA